MNSIDPSPQSPWPDAAAAEYGSVETLAAGELIRLALAEDLGEADGVMVTRAVPDTARYGSVRADATGRITSFAEKQPGAGQINAGVYLLRHELLAGFPAARPLSLERDVFPGLIEKGLRAHAVEAAFLDIGTPETLPQAEIFVAENESQFA